MTLTNTYIERFVSNKDYSNQTSYAYFNNSKIDMLTLNDCEMLIFNNSYIDCYFENKQKSVYEKVFSYLKSER